MSREYTNLLIEAAEDGYTSKEQLFDSLMSYLSEHEVKQFCLESEDRETAWMLAEKIGNQGADFTDHEELESEWEYIKESE